MNTNIRTMAISVMKRYQGDEYIFSEELFDYLTQLSTLEKIEVESDGKSINHKQFLKNLLLLESNFRVFGNKFLSEEKVEPFATKLESMFNDYKQNNLKNDFYQLRKNHYSRLAFNR
jgi:hypothetical protein